MSPCVALSKAARRTLSDIRIRITSATIVDTQRKSVNRNQQNVCWQSAKLILLKKINNVANPAVNDIFRKRYNVIRRTRGTWYGLADTFFENLGQRILIILSLIQHSFLNFAGNASELSVTAT